MKKNIKNLSVALLHLGVAWPITAHGSEAYPMELLRQGCQIAINYDDAKKSERKPLDFEDTLMAGICYGHIEATIRTYDRLQRPLFLDAKLLGIGPFGKICVPQSWTVEQGIRIFLKWVNENPPSFRLPAEVGVLTSHLVAFPCPCVHDPEGCLR